MSNPSPTACGLIWLRGLSDGETGGDAPRIDDDELCALYVTARGIGLQRSGRVIPAREPMRLDPDECRPPAPDLAASCVGGEVGEPSREAL